jgi:hypothetical protein
MLAPIVRIANPIRTVISAQTSTGPHPLIMTDLKASAR